MKYTMAAREEKTRRCVCVNLLVLSDREGKNVLSINDGVREGAACNLS